MYGTFFLHAILIVLALSISVDLRMTLTLNGVDLVVVAQQIVVIVCLVVAC
jgi:hypothetical protein